MRHERHGRGLAATMALLQLAGAAILLSFHAALPVRAADAKQPISVSIPATTVTLQPDRKDLTVGLMQVLVTCQRRQAEVSVNCLDFRVNGREIEYRTVTGQGAASFLQEYPAGSKAGEFLLPALSIEFSPAEEAYVCIAISATLNEIPKQFDSYYFTGKDRYAVLTWCSVERIPAWGWDNARVTNNRAATFGEFRQRLAAPVVLPMSGQPLPTKLDGRTFRAGELRDGNLYQCGRAVPMPSGRVENDLVGAGIYMLLDMPLGPGSSGTFPRGQELHCP